MTPIIRSAARDDILRQYGWYLDDAGATVAERFLNAVQTSVDIVTSQPGIGAPRFLANPLLAGLRSWPVKGFAALRIYYLVQPEHVIVVRILHGQRDVGAILEDQSPDEPV
ncbi:type II toxin-antitoxin system RelE/ParE family toxin [Labrys wisconsinensis]|uniref:Toxin ParE1/3/4 n=1 Tax=Labrys wisconsinensis TaxID=425677 RepID=A0ABU0JH87_9HYPH|nr:type II toxin-antitoxin system RelE/ParE family toxin [Labrys wisconsinensis]MDQ0473651.1 toxin ParE1/3/4 [Labrys wisconsinensis]